MQAAIILKAKAGADLPEAGLKQDGPSYMVREGNSGTENGIG